MQKSTHKDYAGFIPVGFQLKEELDIPSLRGRRLESDKACDGTSDPSPD